MASKDSFGARADLEVGGTTYEIFRVDAVEGSARLPYSPKVLLENLLRTEDGANITADHDPRARRWDPAAEPDEEIQFTPARVIMQDFTGVPCVVDLATMREADGATSAATRPRSTRWRRPSWSSTTRSSPTSSARPRPFEPQRRARVRAQPRALPVPALGPDRVRRVQGRAAGHRHRAPGQHRVTSRAWSWSRNGQAYPDTCVGTDSHTTMVNGLGVLGWGVGGIEAEAAMLGQPVSMLIPRVVGFKLSGELPEGATATDLVLTITEMLRKHGVVGKFVEFYGDGRRRGAAGQPRHDRQHEPGVRLDRRDLPDRRRDAALPAPHRSHRRADRARRGLRQGPGPLARRRPTSRSTPSTSSSTSATVVPVASPARSARRTA